MKSKYTLLGGTLLLCSALLTGCGSKEEVVQKEVVRPVEVFPVSDSSSQFLQNFPALVAPSDESELSFRVSGELVEMNVVSGAEVKKGDVIAQIDPTDYEVKVKEAKAAFDLALKTYERQKKNAVHGSDFQGRLRLGSGGYGTVQIPSGSHAQ
ncbi:MAG: hypothetical protein AseanaTS_21620 [Candidatus Pelagadaptatus aseana]|uniref:biotin/lipoyl-binding protein n=1 Tax=Candidatus Pelagadaptatus aseana TaxID=3120508 RepID=UPI0039B13A1D